MIPLGLLAYRGATFLASPAVPRVLWNRARAGKEDPRRIPERLGRDPAPRPEGALIWLHGASVGEGLSLLALIETLRARRRDVTLLLTTGTVAAAAVLEPRLPAGVLHRYAPVDVPGSARRFMRAWRPDLAVFAESDLWPNLILEAERSGARLVLLSARLSSASLRGWSRAPKSARRLLQAFSLVMAQDDQTAAALLRLGARDDGRLNLKRFTPSPPVSAAALEDLEKARASRRVLLAASTHPGEEELFLDAAADLEPAPLIVLAPRHPTRADAVAEAVRRRGLTLARRSLGQSPAGAQVYLADTLGELGLLYAFADAALVGGSLVPGPGGHNPFEPALLSCPIVTGPHVVNWAGVYADLQAADAVVTAATPAELRAALVADTPEEAKARAARAFAVAASDRDALEDAAARLAALLP